ncbi:Fic family protein [bacterium]|jgi:Fic family protein|nr:Fic family protein [bacterium]
MDFTPIIPTQLNGIVDQELLVLAEEVCTKSAMLVGTHNIHVINGIQDLLRKVNSYYSNKIESEGTHPIDIDKAMRQEYSQDKKAKNLQLLSLAHISTQRFVEEYCSSNLNNPYSKEFILKIHSEFYNHKGMESFLNISNDDKTITMIAGELRDTDVTIGNHIAPSFLELNSIIEKYECLYKIPNFTTQALKLIYAISSHHRLVWIHPFLDGNGRVSRLALDGVIINMNLTGYGLWNISRGLARDSEKYKYNLALADMPRQGDLDGRGALSTKELTRYVKFMLEVALDQVEFMKENLNLSTLSGRIDNYILNSQQGMYDTQPLPKHTKELFKELLVYGELPRGKVQYIIGTKDRVASSLIKTLVDMDFLESNTPRGNIRIKFNSHFATHIFPQIVPMV